MSSQNHKKGPPYFKKSLQLGNGVFLIKNAKITVFAQGCLLGGPGSMGGLLNQNYGGSDIHFNNSGLAVFKLEAHLRRGPLGAPFITFLKAYNFETVSPELISFIFVR